MTKRHFQRLAQALSAARKDAALSQCPLSDDQYEILVDQIALVCGEYNPRFDYTRFADAANQ